MDLFTLERMILSGVNICRLNGSHGDHAMMQKIIDNVRLINEKLNKHIAILFDLQGPKIRIGDILEGSFTLNNGTELILTPHLVEGNAEQVFIKYPQFHKDVKVGDSVLIDDGKLELRIEEILSDERVRTKVIHGGILSSRKGVNLPNTEISLPSLTEKDRADLLFALENNVEWIGLSFVRKPQDVIELKEIIKAHKKNSKVVAKIEKPSAVDFIDEIIEVSDAIMVARGDLGVEMAMEKVPMIQKMIVEKANKKAKPVIIATQMMESMISNYRPTRAEANDVANAVYDGADALMLSGETSVGNFPIETVQAMYKIISEVEKNDSIYFKSSIPNKKSLNFIPESICLNACEMARHSEAKAIIAMTHSGMTAFRISSHRPKSNIYIFTDNKSILNTLSLLWGVQGFFYDKYESTDNTVQEIKDYLKSKNLIEAGDYIINVASTPLHARATANTIKLTCTD
jgi:pyruvate kinase